MEMEIRAILGKVCWSLLYNSTAQHSFSKLRLIKMFHRSTMTDERLRKLEIISIECETDETIDMADICIMKTWKKSYP